LLTTLVSYPPKAADTGNFKAVPTHLFAKAPFANSDDEAADNGNFEAVPTHLFAKDPFANSDNKEGEDESNSDKEETEVNCDCSVALSRPKAETFADVVESSGGRRAKRTHHEESTLTKRCKVSKLQL
jgi:hypothetical protein